MMSDFASFSRAEKAILPVMTLIYTIQRRSGEKMSI
jgi:hypothetical protein